MELNITEKIRANYKGYKTIIYYDHDDKIYFGKLEYITDLVNFHAFTIQECIKEFQFAVDDYIEMCKYYDKKPNVPIISLDN